MDLIAACFKQLGNLSIFSTAISRKANICQVAKWIAPLGFLFALALHLGERLLCIEDGSQQDMILDIIYPTFDLYVKSALILDDLNFQTRRKIVRYTGSEGFITIAVTCIGLAFVVGLCIIGVFIWLTEIAIIIRGSRLRYCSMLGHGGSCGKIMCDYACFLCVCMILHSCWGNGTAIPTGASMASNIF
jgi:hypothetical protein